MALFNLTLLGEQAYTSVDMISFKLTFIFFTSYLYSLSLQVETALSIDLLLKVFPITITRTPNIKPSKRKERVMGSSCRYVKSGNSLFACRFFCFLKFSAVIFVLFCTCMAKAQVYYPTFYPEKDLLTSFQHAKTLSEQTDASGVLALYYRSKFEDSLSSVYLHLMNRIANVAYNQNLLAKTLWWDAQVCACGAYDETKQAIAKANSLLHFAVKMHLYPEVITAKLLLADQSVKHRCRLKQ